MKLSPYFRARYIFAYALVSFILFCAVYNIKIKATLVPLTLYLSIFGLMYYSVRHLNIVSSFVKNKYVFLVIGWIISLIIFSVFISTLIGNGVDYSIPYNFLIWLLLFIIPAALATIIIHIYNVQVYKGIKIHGHVIIAYISLLQALFIIASLLLPDIRDWFSMLLEDYQETLKGWEHRVTGLSGTGGAALSIIQAVGAAICIKLFAEQKKVKWLLFAVVITSSILPVGRSGLLFITIFSVLFLIPSLSNRKLLLRFFGFLILLSTLLFLIVRYGVQNSVIQGIFDFVLLWGFQPFRYIGSILDDPTVQAIASMWVWPQTFTEYLFGSGIYLLNGSDYVGDPGYLKNLHYFGLSGMLIYYGLFIWLMVQTVRFSIHEFDKHMVIILYFCYFLFELKEPFFGKTNVVLFFLFFNALINYYYTCNQNTFFQIKSNAQISSNISMNAQRIR